MQLIYRFDGCDLEQINAGNHVTVFGYSQSRRHVLEMQHSSRWAPNASQPQPAQFHLDRHDESQWRDTARIPGLNVTTLGLLFYGATPDNPYPVDDLHLEYDGFTTLLRYPPMSRPISTQYSGYYGAHHVCGPHYTGR